MPFLADPTTFIVAPVAPVLRDTRNMLNSSVIFCVTG